MLRHTWDWDVSNENWRLCGDWVFFNCLEELEKKYPLTVSIKQIWYDLQEMDCFNKVGMWHCRDEALWKEAILVLFDRYFVMTVNYVSDSLGCITGLDSEHGLSVDTDGNQKMEFAGATVAAKSANREGKAAFDLGDGKSKHESSKHPDKRGWLSAENVTVSNPEFSPDVISQYLQVSENLRKNLTQKFRKHLLYVGWKIEYRKEPLMTRMRYTSPVGKVYMSLVKICEDIIKDSEEKGSQTPPKCRSGKMLLGQSNEGLKPKVTSSTSIGNVVVFEPEFCPEALESWCKYMDSNGLLHNQCRETVSLKAKKHLSAMGWTFSYIYKEKKRELRYMSPQGKVYYSLRKACEECIKDTANVKFETPGRCNPSENMAIVLSVGDHLSSPVLSSPLASSQVEWNKMHETTPHHIDVSLQKSQPNVLVGGIQLGVKEKHVTRHNKKMDVVPKEPVGEKNMIKAKATVRHASMSVLRGSKRIREAAIQSPSHNNPRTVLSLLIDRSVVLPRTRVQYICRKNGKSLKSGQVSREGIWCDCCSKIYSLSAFESHAGSSIRRPSANIFLEDGRSLMECQRQIVNQGTDLVTEKSDQKFERAYPENDILCCICHYAGELMLCDRCPASFHMSCLGLKEIPDGDWFCPSCRCALCGVGEFSNISSEGDVLRCYQCEHQYHLSCLRKKGSIIEIDDRGNRFCSAKCKKICSGLNNLLGKQFELIGSDNLTWTIVSANKCGSSRPDLAEMDTLTENHSKLNVALSIMHECFEPLKDHRTKRDMVEDVIFSRSSEYSRLNYRGFYTVMLERNEELITAATVRIFGDKVAEVPLVGTRFQYRRLGMCRFLMNELERKLTELGIERLVLPAVPGVLETWTNSFGFSQMTESERLQFLSYTFLDFLGTTMCQKFLQDKLPGNSAPSQVRSEERSTRETLPTKRENVILTTGQQATNSILKDKCVQDRLSDAALVSNLSESSKGPSSLTSRNLKRKTSCLDINDLKVYKRRACVPS